MKISMAVLCDRATIREGLIHMLGGGVTQCSLTLPGSADLDLALLIQAEGWSDLAGRHTLTVNLRHDNGEHRGMTSLVWDAPSVEPQEISPDAAPPLPQLPIIVPLRSMILSEYGTHRATVLIDGKEAAEVTFSVAKSDLAGVTAQLR
ncbi:DUF6941 family protein [Streptomyces sp. NPDC059928]|uniref:DUF6941 family protein n=1 Tax=unclassified Streptomyces TaxID=2593676 RepID=UPI00364EBE34